MRDGVSVKATVSLRAGFPAKLFSRDALSVFLGTWVVFLAVGFGGLRSPDAEIMYRTAESLARHSSFEIEAIAEWPTFGVATSLDGRTYGKFGPGLSVASSPLVILGGWLSRFGWWEKVDPPPISIYENDGLMCLIKSQRPEIGHGHAIRAVVSTFNAGAGALAAVVFFLILRRQHLDRGVCLLVTVVFAFGSLFLVYTGTYFSEVLTTLFVLLALYSIEAGSPRLGQLAAGGWLGAAVATHITSLLWAPFFLVLCVRRSDKDERSLRSYMAASARFGFLITISLVFLGILNYVRFGGVLMTGRPDNDFVFLEPWRGLWGLLFSPGRGLLVYSPICLAGVVGFYLLIRKRPFLGSTLLLAVFFRVLFFAGFHDWHGGFGLGPRYLVPAIPVLLLPLGLVASKFLLQRSRRRFCVVLLITGCCISQQLYYAVGEVFEYQHRLRWSNLQRGVDVFVDDALYLDLDLSPNSPAYLFEGRSGPWLLRSLGWSPVKGWLVANSLYGYLAIPLMRFLIAHGCHRSH